VFLDVLLKCRRLYLGVSNILMKPNPHFLLLMSLNPTVGCICSFSVNQYREEQGRGRVRLLPCPLNALMRLLRAANTDQYYAENAAACVVETGCGQSNKMLVSPMSVRHSNLSQETRLLRPFEVDSVTVSHGYLLVPRKWT
jgi:hypothetical protein